MLCRHAQSALPDVCHRRCTPYGARLLPPAQQSATARGHLAPQFRSYYLLGGSVQHGLLLAGLHRIFQSDPSTAARLIRPTRRTKLSKHLREHRLFFPDPRPRAEAEALVASHLQPPREATLFKPLRRPHRACLYHRLNSFCT